MLKIQRVIVKSTNVRSYGYDPESQTIQVQFVGGDVYEYYKRPASMWRDFQLAESKGKFVQTVLTPGRNYKKVA